jgi:hypothetical protein
VNALSMAEGRDAYLAPEALQDDADLLSGVYLRRVTRFTLRTKLSVSSLLPFAASSAAAFCSIIPRSLTQLNVPLSGSEDKPAATG